MWVIVVLLLIGGTIVCVRLFRNGALQEAELEALESPSVEAVQPPAQTVRTRAKATELAAAAATAATAAASPAVTESATPRRGKGKASATPGSPWPGGDCPACGSPTVRAAKFCGECGHRLTT